jgi:hypothetical protein
MVKNIRGIIFALLAFCLCIAAPLAVCAAQVNGQEASPSPAPAEVKPDSMMKGYDLMMKGANILTGRIFRVEEVGTDKTVEKRKGKIREGLKLITDGQAMIQSASTNDEAAKKMLEGADIMATGAGMMMKSPTMMDVLMDGKKMVIDGRKIMMKAKKMM